MGRILLMPLFVFLWLSLCNQAISADLVDLSTQAGSLDTFDLNDDYSHVIYVDPTNPNSTNDSSCYLSSEQHPCGDINIALAFPHKTNSTIFVLSSTTTHYLANHSSTTVFIDGSQVAFYGNRDNGTAVVKCTEGAGLAFLNSSDITINKVSFQHCGAWRDSTSVDFSTTTFKLKQIRVGLYFYNCRDVTMVSMSVLNSTEALGVVMYSTVGVNNITHSQFNGNRISESNMEDSGGGGFAVEFNYCKPGDSNCSDQNHQTEGNSNAVYIFMNCSFAHNLGIDQSGGNSSGVSILPQNETHSSLGRGGGLSLFFKGTAFNNSVTVEDCTFERNHANWGGGICVQFADQSIQNQVTVVRSNFVTNHCFYKKKYRNTITGATGGGVLVSSPVYYVKRHDSLRNSMSLVECSFTQNRALTGGALAFVYTLQRLSTPDQIFQAYVSNCTFSLNQGRLGSAVNVDHEYFYNEGELGQMFFTDCSFLNNTIVHSDRSAPYSVGIGALYISEVRVTFLRSNTFEENNGSALAVVGTRVTFTDNAAILFRENLGAKGAAIALLGGSSMLIGENTEMRFENNRASLFGGAIFNNYVGKEDLRSSVKCFLQYFDSFVGPSSWLAKFVFKSNTADKLGHSIYSTTILPCSWSEDFLASIDIVRDIFCWNETIWIYENSNCSDQIYTSPHFFNTKNHHSEIYPGYPFQLNISAYDDLDHDVTSTTIYTGLINNTYSAQVDPQYAFIANGSLSITGLEEQKVKLEIDVTGSRDWRIELPLFLQRCPPGFKTDLFLNVTTPSKASSGDQIAKTLAQTSCKCIGDNEPYTYGGNLFCDESNLRSRIRNGFWIGFVPSYDNSTLLMGSSRVLLKYSPEDLVNLSRSFEDLEDFQCSHLNRRGPLCGMCIDGYSTAVNSYNFTCVPCTSNTTSFVRNIFAYVGLSYAPYLVVFILIIVFDVRLMSGPAVGFILYAQLIGAGILDVTLRRLPYIRGGDFPNIMHSAYRMVYGVFNLDSFSHLMDPFCVNENFSALDVISLDYAIAAFPLLLIFVLFLILKLINLQSTRFGNRIGNDLQTRRTLIHSLVAFIYLSYTKFTVASTSILTTIGVFKQDGSDVDIRLIYYAGQYYFGQKEYILPYGLIAIFVFIFFAALLPVLLLGPFQFMNWLADIPRFRFINKCWPTLRINTFLDAFQGCYKLDRQYFAGIYFIFRLVMFILYAFTPNELSLVLWQLVFIIILIVLVAAFRPYRVEFYNYVDILIFCNLAAINIIAVYLYTSPTEYLRNGYPLGTYIVGIILIWLPLVYMLLFLCWWVMRKTCLRKVSFESYRQRYQDFRHRFNRYLYVENGEQRPLVSPTANGDIDIEDDSDSSLTGSKRFLAEEVVPEQPNIQEGGTSISRQPVSSMVVSVDLHTTSGTANVYQARSTGSSGIGSDNNGSSRESH